MGGDSSSSTVGAFAAVTQSGRVVTWGSDADGGNSSSVAHKLTNVEFVYPTWHAFAAKTSNSSIVTRGDPAAGGDSSVVADAISSGIADDPGFVPTTTMTYTFTSVTSTSMTSTSSTATTATTSSGTTSTTTVTSTSLTTYTSSTSTTSSTRAPETSFGGVSLEFVDRREDFFFKRRRVGEKRHGTEQKTVLAASSFHVHGRSSGNY